MTDNKFSIRRTLPTWLSGSWGKITIFFALYVLVYLGWIAFRWGGEENVTLIGDLAYLPVDLIAVIAAWRVFTQKNLDPRIRRMWLLLGLAFFSYFLGDLTWAYLENVLDVQPFPSVADVFYLLFAPLAAIGLLSIPGAPLNQRERWRYFFDMLIIMTTAGFLMWYFIIQPTAVDNAGDLLSQAIAVAYPVTDLILIMGIVGALLRQPDRDTGAVLWLLFAGMISFVGADIIYAYTGLAGTYVTGDWVDAGWILAQLIFMIAALRQRYQAPADLQNSRLAKMQDNFVRMLPTIAVATGVFVAIGAVITNYQTQAGRLMSGALVILVLFVVRQFINIQTASFRNRLAWSFVLLAGLTMVVLLSGSFLQFRQASRSAYQERLLDIVTMTAMQQDGDAFLTISSENDAEFQRVRAQNLAIKRISPDFAFVYTMRYDDQGIYFVVDAGEPDDPGLAAFGERYEDPSETLAASYRTMTAPVVDEEIYTDAYGSFLSAYAPIWTDGGQIAGIIGVDIAADQVLTSERDFLLNNLGIFAATLPLIALLGWALGNALASPIQKLAQATAQISKGEFNYQPVAANVPEIQLLDDAMSSMTGQLKSSIENLEQRVAERTRALSSVAEVSIAASTILETDKLLQRVVELAKERFGLYHAHIYLLNEAGDTLVLVSGAGESGRKMVAEGRSILLDREQSLVARAARERKGVTVNDVTQAPDFLPNPLLPETRSELAVPMMVGEQVIGVFDVQSETVGRFTDSDIAVQTTLASQVASAVQNSRSYTEIQRNQALLSDALSISRLANWEYDVEKDLFTFNDNFYAIFRTTAEDVGGYKLSSADYSRYFVHPDDAALVGIEIQKALQSRERHFNAALEHRAIFPDGEVGYMSVRVTVERDENGKILRWYGANQDITERKRLEEQNRRRANQQESLNLITQKIQSADTVESALQVAARELGRALGQKQTLVKLNPESPKEPTSTLVPEFGHNGK
jgi:PAS domain S-box-containing protein